LNRTVLCGKIVFPFGLYAANASQFQTFGFVGAVLLFLLWLYFGALILLFGAVVNAATFERPTPPAD